MLFSIGNLLLIFYQGILSALKKFNLQNGILGVSNVVFLLYLLLAPPTGPEAFSNISIIYAALFFLQGLVMLIFSSAISSEKKHVPIKWSGFIKSGLYIMISSLVYFAFLRVDNFFVEKYESGTVLGNYIQCGKIGQYFLYFSSIISSTILPFISTETVGASYDEWKKMMRPYILLICIAAAVIAITGKYVFPFLLGNEFSNMHKIMIILLPGFVCLGMLTLLNTVYIGKGNIARIFMGDLSGLIIVVVFDAWLVPRYGAYAAAIISSIAYCLVFLFLLSGFKKQFSMNAKNAAIIRL
jgi:O-antigen/teichoic acid export membrane protein